jgi:hypothetical protein
MQNKIVSRLRLSSVQTDAKFVATWNRVTLAQINTTFRPFWQTVDLWDSFTFGATWWSPDCPAALKTLIESCSPTGLWMFDEAPIIAEVNTGKSYTVSATIKGVIL